MRFKTEVDRQAHPYASLIPMGLWERLYNEEFTEEDEKIFTTSFSEFLKNSERLAEHTKTQIEALQERLTKYGYKPLGKNDTMNFMNDFSPPSPSPLFRIRHGCRQIYVVS